MHRHRPSPWLLILCGIVLSVLLPPSGQISILRPAPAAARPADSAPAPANTPPISLVGGLGSFVETVVISGSLAYASEYDALLILDVSDPAQPVVRTRMPFSDQIGGMQVVGELLYLVANRNLYIVDISNPSWPIIRGSLASQYGFINVFVVDQFAYLPSSDTTLRIVDVSDPAHLSILGSINSLGSITDVRVRNNTAFVIGLGDLFILNVSDPRSPSRISRWVSSGSGQGNGMGLDVVGGTVYLAAQGGGLQIIDVSNLASPTLRGSLVPTSYAHNVKVYGNLAYVASREDGLQIIDVSNPAAPTLSGSFATKGQAYDVQVSNGLAYVATYNGGLEILDVTNPAHPTAYGAYMTAGDVQGSWIEGNLAYIAAGDGLSIVDVSTPARPQLIGSLPLPGWIVKVQVVGNLAYLCERRDGTFFIVDVSDPTSPSLIGSYAGRSATDVEVVDMLAYIASGNGGLQILDVSEPVTSTLRGHFTTSSAAVSIDMQGSFAYLVSEYDGLQVIDVSEPVTPTLRGTFAMTTGIRAFSIEVAGDLAYLTYQSDSLIPPTGGLQIIDISDPISPTLRGSFETDRPVRSVQVIDDQAYIGVDSKLQVLDVSDPSNPQLLDSFTHSPTLAFTAGVHVTDGLIYVTGYPIGLRVLSREPEMLSTAATIATSGGQAASADGSVQLDFPVGAVQGPLTVLYLSQLRTAGELDDRPIARRFKVEGLAPSGQAVEQTSLSFTMVISYTDTQLEQLGVQEDKLTLLRWNGESWGDLLPCEGCGVDTEQNRVTIVLDRFGEFALTEQRERKVFLPLVGG